MRQAAYRPCSILRAAGMTSCLQQRSARPRSQLALMCFLPAETIMTVKLQPLRGTSSNPRHHLLCQASAFFIHLLSPFLRSKRAAPLALRPRPLLYIHSPQSALSSWTATAGTCSAILRVAPKVQKQFTNTRASQGRSPSLSPHLTTGHICRALSGASTAHDHTPGLNLLASSTDQSGTNMVIQFQFSCGCE